MGVNEQPEEIKNGQINLSKKQQPPSGIKSPNKSLQLASSKNLGEMVESEAGRGKLTSG